MAAIVITVRRAQSFWARLRGLLGRRAPPAGTALWLTPCDQVHTFFMTYPIDVAYLDGDGCVLATETLEPWRVGSRLFAAASVLELAAGEAVRLGLGPGVKPTLITR